MSYISTLIMQQTDATPTICVVTGVTPGEWDRTAALTGTSVPRASLGCLRYLLGSAQMVSGHTHLHLPNHSDIFHINHSSLSHQQCSGSLSHP